jgi:hypothetical protein
MAWYVAEHCFKRTCSHEATVTTWVFVCSLLAWERVYRFATNLACLFLETRKRTQQRQNSVTRILSSSSGQDGSCSFRTKHDRTTVPRPKLFISKRRLQEERPQRQKDCPMFEPWLSMVSIAWKLRAIENCAKAKFVSAKTLSVLRSHPKIVLGSRSGEDGFRENRSLPWYSTIRIEWSCLSWDFG